GEVKLYSGAMLAAGAATTGTHLVANPDTALISVSGLIPVTTVNGSAIATIGVVGQSVSGSTIAAGTTVSSMTNSTTVALSLPATGSATITAVLGPAVVTLKTTKGKTAATISNVLSVDGLIVGQSVAGSNSVIVTTTSGSKMVNVSSVAGLTVGEPVTGLNIPGNTTISAIGVGTITLSAAATGSGTVIADFDPVASNSIISALGSSVGGITIKLSANIKSTGSNNIFAAGFMPEAATYKSGLYVAAGDLTGSGDIDIVTSRSSTVPNVEVFEVNNLLLGDDIPDVAFNPYTTKFLTGAQIAVGDVDGNGVDQIVTAPGTGQSVQIKVFDYNTVLDDFDNNLAVTPERTFLGFESTFKNSVSLALGDADGDGTDEIMLGAGSGGTSRVRVLDGYGDLLEQFQAFTAGNTSAALRIAAVDVNGEAELFVGQGIVSKTHVIEGFDPLTGKLIDTFMETDPAMTDGIFLG
ncbi:MAG TPA: hypothetical protein VMJ32_07435, partial [Pirellulales bacterium]|nr:hypothetical protein [Pirellulales bacterium]